ncbi:MAG: hypothetical protein FWD82_06210, partial [Defluviitaleaceae bacterium]|nr:hypothetical protein [Defluviitaleaceae bacterium]
YFENFKRYANKEINSLFFAHEKDNCVLIGICPEPDKGGTITDTQLGTVENAIQIAAKRNVPAFVFSHLQIADTIHIEWNAAMPASDSKNIRNIIEKYNGKVVFFSGHTHNGLTKKVGGSVVKINNITYVSTPSITKPNIINLLVDNNSVGTGFIVELCEDNVHIRGYDFLRNEWLVDFEWTI